MSNEEGGLGANWIDTPQAIRALRAGCPRAFKALVAHYQGPLTRVARIFVHSASLAEEVVQEAWLSAWLGLPGFEGRSEVGPWLVRIVRNTARSHWRRSDRRRKLTRSNEQHGNLLELFLAEHHGNWAKHWALSERHWPEGRLLATEHLQRVTRAFDALPQRQREVVWLRDVEGLSSEETRQALGVSLANQRVLLHRGRSRLRELLNGAECRAVDVVQEAGCNELE
jgi:RNA polymerase sigma-70 factor (ECF subfamily)